METQIRRCRICNSDQFSNIIDLGEQKYTGIFPTETSQYVPEGRLELIKCMDPTCGLMQLSKNFDLEAMYGNNYGYRSGLNASMIDHLKDINNQVHRIIDLNDGDCIIDIGSNDGTGLSFYPAHKFQLIGIDPTSDKFKSYYRQDIIRIQKFFDKKLKIIYRIIRKHE